jgi:hypothetical protein
MKKLTVLAGTMVLLGCGTPAAQAGTWDVRLDPGENRNVPGAISPINVDCFSANGRTQYDETVHYNGGEIRFWWRHDGNTRLRAKYFARLGPNGNVANVGTVPVYCQVIHTGRRSARTMALSLWLTRRYRGLRKDVRTDE